MPPPTVLPITEPPAWAGDRGVELLRRTRIHAAAGSDRGEHRGVDPSDVLTDWFGTGDRHSKPALQPSSERFHPRRIRPFKPSWGKRRLPIDPDLAVRECVTVSWSMDGRTTSTVPWHEFDPEVLWQALPMRDFDRRLEKENKPVAPWLHTTGHLVGAESHHERAFMVLADHHPAIEHIAGQPFTLTWPADSRIDSYTPDVALLGAGRLALIADPKSPDLAEDEKWLTKQPEVAKVIHAMGMGYLVWTGMSRPYRLNLEDFTEARVPLASYNFWAPVAYELCDRPTTASDLADALDAAGYQRTWALTLIRRMLWRRALQTNMFTIYGPDSIVFRGDD